MVMISRTELTQLLDALFLERPWNDYGPNGLQVEGAGHIERIALGVTASIATIEAAIAMEAQALIVHHGIFWKADEMRLVGPLAKRVALLLRHKISLYAYHLPMDAHRDLGNNWPAARDLGWSDLQPFGLASGQMVGVQGRVAPILMRNLIAQLEAYYEHEAFHCPGGPKEIERIALVSGSGYRSIDEAARAGVQCLVTGNIDEPAWHGAQEYGIHVLALGHSATERVGPKKLTEYLAKTINAQCQFLDIANPL